MRLRQGRAWLAVTLLLIALMAGCGGGDQHKQVRLSVPGRDRAVATSPTQTQKVPLRVAVAPVISPRENLRLYTPLLDYISRRVDRPVDFLQRMTYSEINDLVRYGQADLAFVCDYAYVDGARSFGMQTLVAPVVMGKDRYQSYIIVPGESDAKALHDLRDRTFAFSDPLSSSGWLYPTYLLAEIGEKPETFFKRQVFTYSHDKTVKAVADKLVDGGAVDSLVYELMLTTDSQYRGKIKVIQQSNLWGTPPVVVHPKIEPTLRATLQRVFLTMHEDEQGRSALASLAIDRFILPDDAAYDDVRQMDVRVTNRK